MTRESCRLSICGLVLFFGTLACSADEPKGGKQEKPAAAKTSERENSSSERPEHFQKFEKDLSGVKFVGQFTVIGKEEMPLSKEEYEIQSVSKLPQGDLWLFATRIKYGKTDVKLPIPLEVKWAGKTPVITLDEITIPTLGTFSARVVIDGNKYAGTWSHGEVGGHLYGVIERLPAPEK